MQYDAVATGAMAGNHQSPSGTQRLFADGKFYTPSGKARMIAVAAQLPAVATDVEFPLVLNTGRTARPVAHDDAHRQKCRA